MAGVNVYHAKKLLSPCALLFCAFCYLFFSSSSKRLFVFLGFFLACVYQQRTELLHAVDGVTWACCAYLPTCSEYTATFQLWASYIKNTFFISWEVSFLACCALKQALKLLRDFAVRFDNF